MGRGRQKAKHTKVARELKYSVYEPNYKALEQELTSSKGHDDSGTADEDQYDSWADDTDDDTDED